MFDPLQSRRRASCSGAESENGFVVYAEVWFVSQGFSSEEFIASVWASHFVQCGVMFARGGGFIPPLLITVTSRRRVACI